ncbi:hypothetical protein G7Y79_00078g099950 [Physcia stellaris]|nr:hypothetical protein G7Y79_00078g099950 [Physcia stellaris]
MATKATYILLCTKLTENTVCWCFESGVFGKAYDRPGDVIRFGPNRLLFNTDAGLHDIYGQSRNVKKAKGYHAILPAPGAFSVHTAIDKDMHRHKRKVLAQGLSDDALKKFEPTLLACLSKFCEKLAEGQGDYLTFDVMGEFGFGNAFNMLEKEENRFIIDAIAASNMRTSVYAQIPELAKFKLEKVFYPQGAKMRQRFLDLTRGLAESRANLPKDHKGDLFSLVVEAKDPETGKGFSLPELWSESKFLIVAGSDTSSTVLASMLFYLAHYPNVYTKLEEEICTHFATVEDIHTGSELTSCTYLRACVYETMRLSPPAGGAMWREVDQGGELIGGTHVPAGFDVGTSMYAIHHNATYYPDPYTFIPERWIAGPENSSDDVERAQRAWNPFSIGPRGCIGRGLALMEISLTIVRLMRSLEFRKAEGPLGHVGEGHDGAKDGRHRVNEFQLVDHLTSQKNGPMLQFRRRKN